jgi:predicted ATPase/DNA-binding CsgD family transcriptional regulator/DNA-binding XRE family transcriptional regulator
MRAQFGGPREGEKQPGPIDAGPVVGSTRTEAAARVRTLRMALGLSQSKLAARLGVSFASVNRWESGQRLPSPRAMSLITRLETGLHARGDENPHHRWGGGLVASVRTNLPVQTNPLVGRADDIVTVRDLLDRSRVVTLTGPGGIGKTRLALEVARQVAPAFPDGAWLADLGSISDPALLPSTVAAALGVVTGEMVGIVPTLMAFLATRRVLLVLDNCEHLIDGVASLVDALVRWAPKLQVLATSRELLDVEGEIVWSVPPLPVRGLSPRETSSDFTLPPAVQLFADRVASRRSDFVVHSGNLGVVIELCERLDGLPLAIELVAAQLDTRSLGDVATGLEPGFPGDLPTRRGGPRRQRSLRSVVDWSYELLSEDERRLFERLGSFAGAFELDAVPAIAGDAVGSNGGLVGGLTKLVRKSLVQVRMEGDLARYRLLHTLRQYARARLDERGDLVATRLRHAAYYQALAIRAATFLYGPGQGDWLDRLDRAVEELRLALHTLTETGDRVAALELAASLGRFWMIRGYLEEGFATLERLLADREGIPPTIRTMALRGGGVIARELQRLSVARAWSEEHRSLAEQLGDEAGAGWALANLAVIAVYEGNARESTPLLEASQARFRAAGDALGLGWATGYIAIVRMMCDQWTGAAGLAAEALAAFRETGDTFGIAWALGLTAQIAASRLDDAAARPLLESALALAQQIGARYLAGGFVHQLGLLATLHPQLLRRGLELRYGAQDPRGITISLLMVACLGADHGEWAQAASLFAAAEATCRDYQYLFLSRPTRERSRVEAALRAARVNLGEEAFTLAWTEGWLFSRAEAVQHAVELSRALEARVLRLSATPFLPSDCVLVPAAPQLTPRERQVLDLVVSGANNAAIARNLGISARTVDRHLTNIYGKLGVANRVEATAFILRRTR